MSVEEICHMVVDAGFSLPEVDQEEEGLGIHHDMVSIIVLPDNTFRVWKILEGRYIVEEFKDHNDAAKSMIDHLVFQIRHPAQ